VSSIHAPAARNGATAHGTDTDEIVHFDATLRRKEKMRSRAEHAPVVESQTPVRSELPNRPASGRANGHTHGTNGNGSRQPPGSPAKSTASPTESAALEQHRRVSPAAPTAHEAAPARMNVADLERFLIEFVVEQTGYPEEMVELDADLEADLGIDSIKKAQLFGELAEHFEIRTADATNLSLDDFPTLRHVVEFLDGVEPQQRAGASKPVERTAIPAAAASAPAVAVSAAPPSSRQVPQPAPAAPAAPALAGPELERFLIDFVVEQTGYPEEMVELDADLEADLGIDSIKKAQLFGELAEHFEIGTARAADLSLDDFPTLRHVVDFLAGSARMGVSANGAAPVHQKNGTNGHVAPPKQIVQPPVASQPALSRPVGSTSAGTPPRSRPTAATGPSQSMVPMFEADEFEANESVPHESVMSTEELEHFLVSFVVEQTGYPAEMVELDADLEADLGIDSIKKAQLFGELAEQFEIQTDDVSDLSLDDFPTLRHVMNFLADAPRRMTV
jgi:acyl carrier protein